MENFEEQTIAEYKYWNVQLHTNQCHLGRCVLWLRRDGVKDLFTVTKEEREELWHVARQLKEAIDQLFRPDLYNYSSLGNVSNHVHVHVIPRYKEKRLFGGQEFIDVRWGSNPYPYDKTFQIPQDVFFLIKSHLQTALSSKNEVT